MQDPTTQVILETIINRLDSIDKRLEPIQTHVANVEGAWKLLRGICILGGLLLGLVKLFQ